MPKERLDLMIDGTVKRMLKDVAASEGLSMSQLVEIMLMEHLGGEPAQENPMWAVSDMLWIQRLQGEFTSAMRAGTIYSLDTYRDLLASVRLSKDGARPLLYLGKAKGRHHEGEIVLDCAIDEHHFDIVSTYDDVLRTVSVRMGWTEAEDGSLKPYDLRIWAKGKVGRGADSLYDWDCGFDWPGMAVVPGREEPTVDQCTIPQKQNPRRPA